MTCLRARAFLVALLATAALSAQTVPAGTPTIEGSVTFSAGGALLDGDRAAWQRRFQHKKDGFGGIEDFSYDRETREAIFKIAGHLGPGDRDSLLEGHWARGQRVFVDFGFRQFRVWSDGSGGYFGPRNMMFRLYDENLHLDRARLWLQLGFKPEDLPYLTLRYERLTRKGLKGSTHWGDTNLVGPTFGTRSIVPTFLSFDETRDIVTADFGRETETAQWAAGLRYDRGRLDNARHIRRRPTEAQDRRLTTKDETSTDLLSAHAFSERRIGEQLTFSTGGMVTTLDTNLDGRRIYGADYDSPFSLTSPNRQFRDKGFFELTGGAEMKQYIWNANLAYQPAKNWSLVPSLRFEDLRLNQISAFTGTAVRQNLGTALEESEGQSRKRWDEFTEKLEVRYTGRPDWTYSVRGEWVQGTGNLAERLFEPEIDAIMIDRKTDYARRTQKYTFTSNWYARPGLTFAAQYYYRTRINDFSAIRDSTPNVIDSLNRYPAYIVGLDLEMDDFNVRASWRPASTVSLVTRYDYTRVKIFGTEAGLGKVASTRNTEHVFSQSAMWSPVPRLYLTANANLAFNQIASPAAAFVRNGDNNYASAALGGGYALGKITDVYFDYSYYRANDFIDDSLITQPYGADEKQHVAAVTWVRRQTDNLIYTVKYTFAQNRDRTSGGHNDFDAHLLYAKVQYRF